MIRYAARALLAALFLLSASCSGGPPTEEPPGPSAGESPEADSPLAYVSLGDSLAVGVGASDPQTLGYTPLYRDLLERETGREVNVINLGVSGETSGSFVSGPGPQLPRAEEALAENPGAVATLSLGANDLLSTSTDADREEALARYSRNLDRILRALTNASDPAPRITVLALYNPAPGSFTDLWTGRLNAQIRSVAQRNGASVAASDEAFRGNEATYAHYARYPWDIHPTDEGYQALARAFAEARKEAG